MWSLLPYLIETNMASLTASETKSDDIYVRGETDIFDYLNAQLKKRILILDGAMGTMIQKHRFTEEDFFAQRATNEIKCLTEHIVSIARDEIRKSRNLLETKWDYQYLALSLQARLSEMYLNKVESLSFDPFSKKIETGQFWRQLKVAVMAARAWF